MSETTAEYVAKTQFTGTDCTETGYCNVELGDKFNAISLEEVDKEARIKFGPLYDNMVSLSDATNAAVKYLNKPRVDQIQIMLIANALLSLAEMRGRDLESEFALYQVWLCKRAGVRVEGIQPWGEYFYYAEEGGPSDEDGV